MRAPLVLLLSGLSFACSSGEFTVSVAGDVGADATRESGADGCSNKNACGGCDTLAHAPGDPCGICGQFACSGLDALRCADRPRNPCGGCRELGGVPGDPCPSCGGKAICDGIDKLKCDAGGPKNPCGGCGTLDGVPGTKCGKCGAGTYTCVGTDAVKCDGDTPLNKCGGCTKLAIEPGTPCPCGSFACNSTESTACATTCLLKEACCTTATPPTCYSTLCLSCCPSGTDGGVSDAIKYDAIPLDVMVEEAAPF